MWAVLEADQGLCRRSWERITAYVGGLGSGSGPKWAVLGTDQGLCGRSWEGIRPDSGPNSSGRAVLEWDHAEKWPKPERQSDPKGSGLVKPPEAPKRICSVDMGF